MNEYLFANENRAAIAAHNEQLIVTTTKQIGKGTTVSHDFNRQEEYRQLNDLVARPDLDDLTVGQITEVLYGADDDHLRRRTRTNLKFGSPFQKQLTNGTAVIARQDGTLRVTRTADEYGDLVETDAAEAMVKISKYVRQATTRLGRNLDGAMVKVPELAERIGQTRAEAQASLGSVFTRQLELLGAD